MDGAAQGSNGRTWRRYAAYRESGVPWLGEVPEHWEVNKLRRGYDIRLGKMLQREPLSPLDTLEPYLRSANVYWQGIDLTSIYEMWLSPDEKKLYSLRKGDLIICEGGDVGRSALWRGELEACYIQNAVHRLRAKANYATEFLYYWMFFLKHSGYIDLLCNRATIAHLTAEKVADLPLYAPPLAEQRTIAAFLDGATAKVDALLAKKQQLVALLQEKRAALISHAVTKGLDPTVPMQESGIPWLGQIPQGWEVYQFKFVAKISYGLVLQLDRQETEGIPILSLPNVTKEGVLLLEEVPRTPLTVEEKKRYLLNKGDLLFNWRNGSSEHIGKTAYFDTDGEFTHVSFLLRLRFDSTHYNPHYYHMFLSHLRSIGLFGSAKAQVNKTYNQTELGRLEVLVPPLAEQTSIANHVTHEVVKLDTLIAKVQTGIAHLHEYRAALISALVTGRVCVAELAM